MEPPLAAVGSATVEVLSQSSGIAAFFPTRRGHVIYNNCALYMLYKQCRGFYCCSTRVVMFLFYIVMATLCMFINNEEFVKFNTRQFLVDCKPLKFVPAINTGLKVMHARYVMRNHVVKHQRSGVLSAALLEHRQGSCFMT